MPRLNFEQIVKRNVSLFLKKSILSINGKRCSSNRCGLREEWKINSWERIALAEQPIFQWVLNYLVNNEPGGCVTDGRWCWRGSCTSSCSSNPSNSRSFSLLLRHSYLLLRVVVATVAPLVERSTCRWRRYNLRWGLLLLLLRTRPGTLSAVHTV